MNSVFVIRGFNIKTDSEGNQIDFENVHSQLISPALDRCGLSGGTTTIVKDAGNIRADMFELIVQADLVVCDITVHNANVFYELGIRHSLRKKHTVMIKGSPSADETPFDLSTDKYLGYSIANPESSVDDLVTRINATLNTVRDTDSPVFLMLPTLSEANPAEITVVPIDLIEEIERAEAVSDAAWLRVIADDLKGQRFEREGLERVGLSQWSIKDLDGARFTWERIREDKPRHFTANRILANTYERQYRHSNNPEHLELSNQAIRTMLESNECSVGQRAEALALQGRNLKTLWRAAITNAADPIQARESAIDMHAVRAYESYRDAFMCDLNEFYPGLAMLQMGYILEMLSEHPRWLSLFQGNQRAADRFRDDLNHELPALTHVVRTAIERARSNPERDEPEWADVAQVDLLFLTQSSDDSESNSATLVTAYRHAIPENKRFVWDATSGQLELFSQLDIKSIETLAVLTAFMQAPEPDKSEHLVVFAGHTLDLPGASSVRFPADSVHRARELISEELEKLLLESTENETVTVLASAAPGADILAHEVCEELGVNTRLCLPMPHEAVSAAVFQDADKWRERFMKVVNSNKDTLLQMSEREELPSWLKGRGNIDPWERGNRWVIQMAQTWNASRRTLLVLWDGNDTDHTGGTAQFVRLARSSGHFNSVRIIDSAQLLPTTS